MKKCCKNVVIICVDNDCISYSTIFKKSYARWAKIKNIKLHVFTDKPSSLKFAKKAIIHKIEPLRFRMAKSGDILFKDYALMKFDVIDMLDNIDGDDFLITGTTHFPSESSLFLKQNFLAISNNDGYVTFDCFSFNKQKDRTFLKLLKAFSNFVFDNEDYFEFINKRKISPDFIIALFEDMYGKCLTERLVNVSIMTLCDRTNVFSNDGMTCFVQNNYFNKYHVFDSKYEFISKNKLSLQRNLL